MPKRIIFVALSLLLLFSAVSYIQFGNCFGDSSSNVNMTSVESTFIGLINGTVAYNCDLELEKIALNHNSANFSFRAAGSVGATQAANWIAEQFQTLGLKTTKESFEFTNWNLASQPALTIYDNQKQTAIQSFQSAHYSWPTPQGGVLADLVVLPLPPATNRGGIDTANINATEWNSIDTSGKIVLVGAEVRWNHVWEQTYRNKLTTQTPSAVVYTWWYSWMSFTPPVFSSAGGRPTSDWGPYYWDLKIPVGLVNYEDGVWIRNREKEVNVSARISIESVIGQGPHYNVVGKMRGPVNSTKSIIISAHYDTVMDAGFCDNSAGTAGVIELARIMTEAVKKGWYSPNGTILFIAFAGEEIGLIGSANYVRQHKAEMQDIAAVINIDSIGSNNLQITQTSPSEGLNIQALVLKAAYDLNVTATLMPEGGSDQEVFRDPVSGDYIYSYWWPGLDSGIRDATPVKSSIMIASYPILYSDVWNGGKNGWIHTSYDNSTSTQTLNWVTPTKLEEQLKVAALSITRISLATQQEATNSFSFPWWIVGIAVAVALVILTVVYFVKIRKRGSQNNV